MSALVPGNEALLKVVRKFSLLLPAQLAQLELRSYGIRAEILDEGSASVLPFDAMIYGIRLTVADADYEEASRLLDEMSDRNQSEDDA
ncbi:hypothetical protein NT6N_01530 [Oceaniferula spumae]|uniref:DUF2007 domain-containing protein n=1 Tax=Oceaniferula spumae TaxID=2979115 RepID=A0AAT9FGK6_9BACT